MQLQIPDLFKRELIQFKLSESIGKKQMKIITASNGKKTLKISKEEWVEIGKKAGFVKTQAKETALSDIDYAKLEYVNDILNDTDPDGTLNIKDPEVLTLVKNAIGEDYSGRHLSPEMVKAIRPKVFIYLREKLQLKKKYRRRTKDIEEVIAEPEEPVTTEDETPEEIPLDEAQMEEVERLRREELEEKKQELAETSHPIDLFDEALQVDPNGFSTISDDVVLDMVRKITGEDYTGVQLSPDAVEAIRNKIKEHFRPSVSENEENSNEDDVISDNLNSSEQSDQTDSGEQNSDDLLPSAPPNL